MKTGDKVWKPFLVHLPLVSRFFFLLLPSPSSFPPTSIQNRTRKPSCLPFLTSLSTLPWLQVECTVCHACSNTYDPLMDLSVDLVRSSSLRQALTRFTATEVLDGENKYRCRCV